MSRPRLIERFGRHYLLPTWYPTALVSGLALVDQGRWLLRRPTTARPIPPLAEATIVIAKPDHFGDLIQATPLLRALRERLPGARLVLVHGSWASTLAHWLVEHDYVHSCVTYDAAWLQPVGTPWVTRLRVERATRAAAAATLRHLAPAAYLDIRCTSPSTIDLALASGAVTKIGFGLRGRSWEYDARIPYDPDTSLGQNWLNVLGVLGLPAATYAGPVLPVASPIAADAPIIVQPGSRTVSKEAPIALWRALLPALAERAPILLVGSADDRARFGELRRMVEPSRQTDLMGATDLPALIRLTGTCRAAVGVESLVAHLAVGHARPTVVLSNPKASGVVAFPEALPSLTFVDMTHDPHHAAQLALAHIDRCLA